MIRALRITTENNSEILKLSDETELEQVQTAVGGLVQAVSLDADLTLWLNEEGKLKNLPHNPTGQHIWDKTFGQDTDYIVGDIVLTGGVDENGATLGLSDKQLIAFALVAKSVKSKQGGQATPFVVSKSDVLEQIIKVMNELGV